MATDWGVALAAAMRRIFPSLPRTGPKAAFLQNINEFYQQEFEAFSADCDWIFLTLQEELGRGLEQYHRRASAGDGGVWL